MEISITPQMDQWISDKVNSALYRSSDEVIAEGLRLLMRQEEQLLAFTEYLRQEILIVVRHSRTGVLLSKDKVVAKYPGILS